MDLSKKLMLIGIGALSLTKEKAEKMVSELTEKGQVSSKETKTILRELQNKGEDEQENIKQSIKNQLEELSNQLNLATKEDLKQIDDRLKCIEAHVFPHDLSE